MAKLTDLMKSRGFIWNPTAFGRDRWTNVELDITCLRQPYMTERQWEAEQQRCAAIADSKAALDRKQTE